MAIWQVQEAKTHFSEVIERANREGPQTITRHGKARAVVISAEEYQTLTGGGRRQNFVDFLLSGPKFDDIDIERSKDTGREIDLE